MDKTKMGKVKARVRFDVSFTAYVEKEALEKYLDGDSTPLSDTLDDIGFSILQNGDGDMSFEVESYEFVNCTEEEWEKKACNIANEGE